MRIVCLEPPLLDEPGGGGSGVPSCLKYAACWPPPPPPPLIPLSVVPTLAGLETPDLLEVILIESPPADNPPIFPIGASDSLGLII